MAGRLTPGEMIVATMIGTMRRSYAVEHGVKDAHRFNGDGYQIDIEGARAEMITAKLLNLYWSGALHLSKPKNALCGDVGNIEVRLAMFDFKLHAGDEIDKQMVKRCHLLLHETDKQKGPLPFVLVVGCNGHYVLAGWIDGIAGTDARWFGDPFDTKRPAYWVPIPNLNPMPELLSMINAQTRANPKL